MKWFVLMVIFTVALHQGVTGFPTNDLNKIMTRLLKKMNASHDLEPEVKKSLLNINVDTPELLKHSLPASLFIEMAEDWSDSIESLYNEYDPLWYVLGNAITNDTFDSEILKKFHVIKDKDTKNQSTLENVSVNKTMRDELYMFTLLQFELGVSNYEDVIHNLHEIVSCVEHNIVKKKAVKNDSSENVPSDELLSVLSCIHVKFEAIKLHSIAMDKHIEKVLDYVENAEEDINTSTTKDEKKDEAIPEDF